MELEIGKKIPPSSEAYAYYISAWGRAGLAAAGLGDPQHYGALALAGIVSIAAIEKWLYKTLHKEEGSNCICFPLCTCRGYILNANLREKLKQFVENEKIEVIFFEHVRSNGKEKLKNEEAVEECKKRREYCTISQRALL